MTEETKKGKELTIGEQIEAWKAKYGKVFAYTADDKTCFLRKPTRKALSAASVIGQKDPLKYNEVLIGNCWLGGDEELRTDDSYFLGLSAKVADLVEIKEGELKEL